MLRRFSVLFLMLLILSFVGEAFHHHKDGDEHPDCAVCMAVVHHKSDAGLTYVPPQITLNLSGIIDNPVIVSFICKSIYTPSLGRAPPA
jgi:hypothetical protein